MFKPQCPSLFGRVFFDFTPARRWCRCARLCWKMTFISVGVYCPVCSFLDPVCCVFVFFHFCFVPFVLFSVVAFAFFILCEIFPWRFFFLSSPVDAWGLRRNRTWDTCYTSSGRPCRETEEASQRRARITERRRRNSGLRGCNTRTSEVVGGARNQTHVPVWWRAWERAKWQRGPQKVHHSERMPTSHPRKHESSHTSWHVEGRH